MRADRRHCLHIHSINSYLSVSISTIQDEGVLLSDCNCNDALADVYEASFLSVFEASAPPSKVAALKDVGRILDALTKRRLMYL